jgi:hypothetical protein
MKMFRRWKNTLSISAFVEVVSILELQSLMRPASIIIAGSDLGSSDRLVFRKSLDTTSRMANLNVKVKLPWLLQVSLPVLQALVRSKLERHCGNRTMTLTIPTASSLATKLVLLPCLFTVKAEVDLVNGTVTRVVIARFGAGAANQIAYPQESLRAVKLTI